MVSKSSEEQEVRVLMVCLGICRSPMAEAVLKHQITQRESLKGKYKVIVDSAGTGAYHEGDDADERTIATCKKHKIPISCTARAVTRSDYDRFDYILAMDNSNLQTLQHRKPPNSKSHISLFGAYDPNYLASLSTSHASSTHKGSPLKPQAISDPYYGGSSGFEKCYEQCVRYSRGFLDVLENGDPGMVDKRSGSGSSRGSSGLSTPVKEVMGL